MMEKSMTQTRDERSRPVFNSRVQTQPLFVALGSLDGLDVAWYFIERRSVAWLLLTIDYETKTNFS